MQNKNTLLIRKNVSLKRYNTFHLGGRAKYLIEVYSTSNLITAIKFCNSLNIKYKVIGLGANILFDDLGYNGAIIVNRSNKIRFYKNSCFVDSGATISEIIKKMLSKNLSGLESLVGIPSTIGGAVVNNSGAFGMEIKDSIEYIECIENNHPDNIIRLYSRDCKFGYRYSIFKDKNYIITRVKLRLTQGTYLSIAEKINYYLYLKSSTQPISAYSAGSVFKRHPISPISKLIDELGLKGYTVGGASVSNIHAGFIVATSKTKSRDVLDLINIITNKIKLNYDIIPELEIEHIEF